MSALNPPKRSRAAAVNVMWPILSQQRDHRLPRPGARSASQAGFQSGKAILLGPWGLLTALVLLAATGINAQSPDRNSNKDMAQRLDISVQPGEVIGHEQIVRCLLKCGTNQFLFMLPPNTRSSATNPETIVLSGTDGLYYLSLRVLESGAGVGGQARSRKEQAIESYPGAQHVEEFSMFVAGHEGSGLQLRQASAVGGARQVRLLWVPSAAGTLEFTLNTDPGNAGIAMRAFECVLLSFQSNERGKIIVIPRSDKT
jgi:hypothetical protein